MSKTLCAILLVTILVMTGIITYDDVVIGQQKTLIKSMTKNKACMFDQDMFDNYFKKHPLVRNNDEIRNPDIYIGGTARHIPLTHSLRRYDN